MNSEVVFFNDGSFKLPYDLKEPFGMAYTVMLKVGEGIVFLPYHQMGYTVEIPLKYDVVDEDGYLKIPTRMMKLFKEHNFTMICSTYSSRSNDGVLLTNKPYASQSNFMWKRSEIMVTLNPWKIPHRPQELVREDRKRDCQRPKFVIKRRSKTEE